MKKNSSVKVKLFPNSLFFIWTYYKFSKKQTNKKKLRYLNEHKKKEKNGGHNC